MQHSIQLQPNNEEITRAEAFVERVCDEWHLPNEFAVISMSVMRAVGLELQSAREASMPISINCGFCSGGIFFEITHCACDVDFSATNLSLDDEVSESVFLIRSLADSVRVLPDEHRLRLVFLVKGIDATQALARQNVLQKFYMRDAVSA